MARKRPPDDEEAELFERALADARPLKREKPAPRAREEKPRPPAPIASRDAPKPQAPVAKAAPGHDLDRRLAERLKRGQLSIDARLDLHGHTLNEAFAALESFVHTSASAGRRCLLVVTGKGREGEGALKRELPHWLARPELRPVVLTHASAQSRHGGTGAVYVLLRRRRA